MDEKIKQARVKIREERLSYDVKKAQIDQTLSSLKVRLRPVTVCVCCCAAAVLLLLCCCPHCQSVIPCL